jgi:hypothetical protein
MREISPVVGMSADEFIRDCPELQRMVATIRKQKHDGTRVMPSRTLIDRSTLLTTESRRKLVDKTAALVDENYVGRAEMCVQFADLLCRALQHLGLLARGVLGTATYYNERGKRIFEWQHAWVRIGKEVIDGNVDSLFENPLVPSDVHAYPYWGPINETPNDRHLHEQNSLTLPPDEDVEKLWWPEFENWIRNEIRSPMH